MPVLRNCAGLIRLFSPIDGALEVVAAEQAQRLNPDSYDSACAYLQAPRLETTQVYAESTPEMIKDSYRRVLAK